jgi:hypothetical protein
LNLLEHHYVYKRLRYKQVLVWGNVFLMLSQGRNCHWFLPAIVEHVFMLQIFFPALTNLTSTWSKNFPAEFFKIYQNFLDFGRKKKSFRILSRIKKHWWWNMTIMVCFRWRFIYYHKIWRYWGSIIQKRRGTSFRIWW